MKNKAYAATKLLPSFVNRTVILNSLFFDFFLQVNSANVL